MPRPKNVAKPVDSTLLQHDSAAGGPNNQSNSSPAASSTAQPHTGERRSARHKQNNTTASSSHQQQQQQQESKSKDGEMRYVAVAKMSVSTKQKENCYDAKDLCNPRVLLQAVGIQEYDLVQRIVASQGIPWVQNQSLKDCDWDVAHIACSDVRMLQHLTRLGCDLFAKKTVLENEKIPAGSNVLQHAMRKKYDQSVVYLLSIATHDEIVSRDALACNAVSIASVSHDYLPLIETKLGRKLDHSRLGNKRIKPLPEDDLEDMTDVPAAAASSSDSKKKRSQDSDTESEAEASHKSKHASSSKQSNGKNASKSSASRQDKGKGKQRSRNEKSRSRSRSRDHSPSSRKPARSRSRSPADDKHQSSSAKHQGKSKSANQSSKSENQLSSGKNPSNSASASDDRSDMAARSDSLPSLSDGEGGGAEGSQRQEKANAEPKGTKNKSKN